MRRTHLALAGSIAVVGVLGTSAVAPAKVVQQRINTIGGQIKVDVSGTKTRTVKLLELRFLCPTTLGNVKAPSKRKPIAQAKLSKSGSFTLRKTGVAVRGAGTTEVIDRATITVKGRLVKNKLSGSVTVKGKECSPGKINLDNGG